MPMMERSRGGVLSQRKSGSFELCVVLAVVASGAMLGCVEQDLSIGWHDVGTADADVAPEAGRFVLVWRDDFDSFDLGRWEIAEHTFEENHADFARPNATVEGGFLKLAVRVKPAGSPGKPYSAAEVRTWSDFACGKFMARARIAPGAGITSTFFAFHDFTQSSSPEDWNEIVIETSAPNRIDYVYTRPNASLPGGRERVPFSSSVAFDAASEFHVYGFEWTPTEVRFVVDGAVTHELLADVAAELDRPKRIMLSAYPSSRLLPARSFDPSVLPSEALYDWVEVYRYAGACPTGGDAAADAQRE